MQTLGQLLHENKGVKGIHHSLGIKETLVKRNFICSEVDSVLYIKFLSLYDNTDC